MIVQKIIKTTGDYIEYCEEDVKTKIKPDDSDMEAFQRNKATRMGRLKTHIESVHLKVKYPCNQCHK